MLTSLLLLADPVWPNERMVRATGTSFTSSLARFSFMHIVIKERLYEPPAPAGTNAIRIYCWITKTAANIAGRQVWAWRSQYQKMHRRYFLVFFVKFDVEVMNHEEGLCESRSIQENERGMERERERDLQSCTDNLYSLSCECVRAATQFSETILRWVQLEHRKIKKQRKPNERTNERTNQFEFFFSSRVDICLMRGKLF